MRSKALPVLALAVLAALPMPAQAQRWARDGRVWGPNGLLYDTRSPEWRAAGSNPDVYRAMMAQRQFVREQQAIARQQQAWLKQQQAQAKQQQAQAKQQAVARKSSGGTTPAPAAARRTTPRRPAHRPAPPPRATPGTADAPSSAPRS